MDSTGGYADGREGIRIEVQALQLSMYRLMRRLCALLGDRAGLRIGRSLERELAALVRQRFWNGHYLNDGIDDATIRPNLFVAAYVYPELLPAHQWRACFDNVLPRLWTGFGLTSIDRHSKLFHPEHTGENDKSYHRGDSWYWINNIAAIVLHRFGRVRYARYVHAILEASTRDILWLGIPGCASELSSASRQEAFGCLDQAWSAATYIELINELF